MLMLTASAADVNIASNTEDSNLTNDNVIALSQENLEVSSEVSISETNIVNSHDDNLNDYPEDSLESYYEDNREQKLSLANEAVIDDSVYSSDSTLSSSADDVLAGNVSTKLSVVNTHYTKDNTQFKVTLQDSDGKALSNAKISFKVGDKTYSATTNNEGIANVKTDALTIGTYSVLINYAGNSTYSDASLSKKVKVLSSIIEKNVTIYAGKYYSATFWNGNSKLANTDVTFKVDGKSYVFKTDKDGVAKVKVNLKPGNHVITSTNPKTGEKLTSNVTVLKDKTTITGKSKFYILPNNLHNYWVTLTSSHGVPLKNYKVTFTYCGKKTTVKTNEKGQAALAIPASSKGTYKISYKFNGDSSYYSSSSSGTICFKAASNKLIASDLTREYKDGSCFTVKFTDNSNKPLVNKTIKFNLINKEFTAVTDSKGVAKLNINALNPTTYKIKYSYSKVGESDYNFGYKVIVVKKQTVNIVAKDLVMKHKDGSAYKVTIKNKSGKVIKNITVKFTINGKTYTKKTNSKGIAQLKISLPIGYYSIKSKISDKYKRGEATKHVLVNGTKFIAKDIYVSAGITVYYSVKLVDGKNLPVKNKVIKFLFRGKNYSQKTNSKGVATINVGVLSPGDAKVKYTYGSSYGYSTVHVLKKVALKDLISASKDVRNYIQNHKKLPTAVRVGDIRFSTAEYLYLVSTAIINLNSNNKGSIAFKDIKDPKKPVAAEYKGNLVNYLGVAKSVVRIADKYNEMPNGVNSGVGNIGYDGLVFAFARVIVDYGENNKLPSSVVITDLSGKVPSNLAQYLAASTNCHVNNAQIKQLVSRLTSGLTSDWAKATALYNYVRDAISYSFYYDTKYGSVGTLNAKQGNCVDQAHLLVAMYRTAGLPARYAHGTCTFSSGTYGHVWTQVYVNNNWVVGDPTSPRNSFGNVVNWNVNSYSLKGYYQSISF